MTRRLTDLYKTGEKVSFNEEGFPELEVWVQKLQPFEQDICIARAQGERAKIWTLKRLPESDPEKSVYYMEVDEEFDHDNQIALVASEELSRALQSAEAFVSMDDPENNEWSKDNYLEGLREAWEEGAQEALFNEDDPKAHEEAKRVFEELKRFNALVQAEFDNRREEIIAKFERTPANVLRDKAVDKMIEVRADMRWMTEYEKSEVWLATRLPDDHSAKYFKSREEVDQCHRVVLNRLVDQYKQINVAPEEGKG